ncbi:MAG: sigma-54-dependent Fis family transcriptional regulator [Calditrichaeota bacterium]|nr:MAG: sigma-54-dependent Fis family transcriptional regulator [Calditrichota bacterium]
MVASGAFREDLYYRLKIVTIEVPPLRERADDIPLLVEHILSRLNWQLHRQVTKVSPSALRRLQSYHWPGNVRQLENVLTRALVQCKGDVLMQEHLTFPEDMPQGEASSPASFSLKQAERQHILRVLQASNWQKNLAAARLGISKPTLYAKIKEYGLHPGLDDDQEESTP